MNAQSANISGTLTANALSAQSANIAGTATVNAINTQTATVSGISNLNGNVIIGTTAQSAKLEVNGSVNASSANITGNTYISGTIRAHEVKVCLSQGCDYVFEKDYELMNLSDLNDFIKTNKHLPDIAPAAEMEAEGINISEMNALLLRKIEELTLYILGQENQMKELEKRLSGVENKNVNE